ncbi:hypothetical protein BMAGB8_A1942 [Burkholderia mallei GB8 horse 4]|nr:hypothetical protein BMAGB8_A1942 [Burkholderia mallei GB8 horse 4]
MPLAAGTRFRPSQHAGRVRPLLSACCPPPAAGPKTTHACGASPCPSRTANRKPQTTNH